MSSDSIKTFEKDPNAVKNYTFDWAAGGPNDGSADDRGFLQGDTIGSATFVVPVGLTKVSETNDDTTATVRLSGGVFGRTYLVTCRMTQASSGEIEDRSIRVKIVQT